MYGSDVSLHIFLLILKHFYSTQLVTCTYTSSAENTTVHIVKNQWIILLWTESLCTHFQTSCLRSDVLYQHLQFTVSVLRTCRTIFRMSGQKQLQSQHSQTLQLRCLCFDHHSVFCLQCTGSRYSLLSFHFYHTHTTGAQWA